MAEKATTEQPKGPKQKNQPVYIAGVSRSAARVIAEELARILLEPDKGAPVEPEAEAAATAAAAAAAARGNQEGNDLREIKNLLRNIAAKLSPADAQQQQVQPNTNNQKNKPWYKRGFENL